MIPYPVVAVVHLRCHRRVRWKGEGHNPGRSSAVHNPRPRPRELYLLAMRPSQCHLRLRRSKQHPANIATASLVEYIILISIKLWTVNYRFRMLSKLSVSLASRLSLQISEVSTGCRKPPRRSRRCRRKLRPILRGRVGNFCLLIQLGDHYSRIGPQQFLMRTH